MATLVFGTDSSTTYGVVQSKSLNKSAEVAEARDHEGKVIAQKAYSKGHELQMEVLFDSEAELPEAGETITVDAVEYLVTSCNETSSNTEYKKASITATKKDDAELTALTAAAPTGGE